MPDAPDGQTEVALFAARQGLGELVEQVRATRVPVYLTRRGRRVAMIVALPEEEDPDR